MLDYSVLLSRVQVFMPARLTRVPAVVGRDRRRRSAWPYRHRGGYARPNSACPRNEDGKPPMAVGVDLRGNTYGLLIDQIGEVLKLADDGREDNPVNLDPRMAKLADGLHRLDGQLMVVLDVDRVSEIVPDMLAA